MAVKITCDACGKELKYGIDLVYYITIRTDRSSNKIYDFCNDCYNEFINHSFKEKGEDDENPNS